MSNVLEKEDVDLFYKLYSRLLCFVNEQAQICQPGTLTPDEFLDRPLEERAQVRDALYNQID